MCFPVCFLQGFARGAFGVLVANGGSGTIFNFARSDWVSTSMPRTLAREMKELVADLDKSKWKCMSNKCELKRNPCSATGFVDVIEVNSRGQ